MQKILFCLRLRDGHRAINLTDAIRQLLTERQDAFLAASFAVADEAVAPAAPLVISNTSHPQDAMISLWCHHGFALQAFTDALSGICGAYQRYDVMESRPLPSAQQPGRVSGMCQIAFIRKNEMLSDKQFLDIWLNSHTDIAIETQSTFGYRQNITVMATANGDWPLYDAVVEENFPAEAMTDRAVFFAAESDPQRYQENEQRMIESCMRFIDFTAFDCVPMSEYIVSPLPF